jgi:hypothetical protein
VTAGRRSPLCGAEGAARARLPPGDVRDKYVFKTPLVVEISKDDARVLLVTTQ